MADLVFVSCVALLYFLAWRRPGVACGYVLSSYALEQFAQAFVPLAGRNDVLCNYLIAFAVVIAVARRIMRDGLGAIRFRAPSLLFLLLLGYCYATVLWSIFPETTSRLLNAQVPYMVVFVGLAPLAVNRPEDMDDCLASLIASIFTSLGLLVLFAEWGHRGVVLPYQGWESNPLALTQTAGALLIAALLSPTLAIFKQPLRGAVVLAVLCVVTMTFLRSASRGQIVAALSTTVLFASTRRGTWWIPMTLAGIGGIVASGLLADEVARNASRWDPDQVGKDISVARVGQAEELLRFWASSSPEHVWLGLGHATSNDPRLLGMYPHVVPAEVLGEEGLVGAVLYGCALIVSGFFYLRAYRLSTSRVAALIRVAAALYVYEFLLTLKQGTLLGATAFLLLGVLAGSLALAPQDEEEEAALPDQDPGSLTPLGSE